MKRLSKFLVIVVVVLPLFAVGGLSQTQTVTVNVTQSLYLDCAASSPITYTVTKADIEASQPIDIGSWGCNVDALTAYRLEADMVINTPPTNVIGATADDFSEDCDSATGGGTPACGAGGTFGPITLGTGGNTAGTPGADFTGDVFVNLSTWDVPLPPGTVNGTITYSVSDTTP